MNRTDIIRGLDDLVDDEEGFKFQSLAVILAMQKWPDLIASERKNDLGLDAYAPASGGTCSKAVACSITGTLGKIKKDAKRILENYPGLGTLIFYTPRKVTNDSAESWIKKIGDEFGLQLIVVTREDLILSLMNPSNAPLCVNFLGVRVPLAEATQETLEAAREACDEQVENWLQQPRLSGLPLIRLRLSRIGEDGELEPEGIDLESIQGELSLAQRLVLEAPAGAGKTTTLIQLAKSIADTGGLCLIVNLPAWIDSAAEILDYVAGAPSFRSRCTGPAELARLTKTVHVDFLLNGWNEISEADLDSACQRLAELERNYPAAGIIVATRAHSISPPLPGAVRVRVRELSGEQRRGYLYEAIGELGPELLSGIEADRTLEGITRNPLMLSEVTKLLKSGRQIPKTKLDILMAMAERIQGSEEHGPHLRAAPLADRAEAYLSALAFDMTCQGAVIVHDEDARRSVSNKAESLRRSGQITTSPEPASVLNSLSAHHLLERLEYPSASYRFQHQQFQEFYAALPVARLLSSLVSDDAPDRVGDFQQRFLDQPTWEEPIHMIAAAVDANSPVFGRDSDPVELGERLVEWAILVDPIFAAALSRECGSEVWSRVAARLGAILREWYAAGSEHHQRCALAGMFATGSADFADIIIPLLTSGDQQVRLRAYRSAGEFHVSSLGSDWREVVNEWDEDLRVDFLHEVILELAAVDVAKDFADFDPSERVRTEAIKILSWLGANDTLAVVFENLSDDGLIRSLSRGLRVEDLPSSARIRAAAAFRNMVEGVDGVVDRLRVFVRLANLGDPDASDKIKADLGELPESDLRDLDESILMAAIDAVQNVDEEWTSQWIAGRIADGSLWVDRWIGRVKTPDPGLLDRLLETICSEEVASRRADAFTSLLIKGAHEKASEAIFRRLFELETRRIEAVDGKADQSELRISSQLEKAARRMPPSLLVSGVRGALSDAPTLGEISGLINVLGAVGDKEPDVRQELNEADLEFLRDVLVQSQPIVMGQNDFGGGMKARLALALARVGNHTQSENLRKLIYADIERVRMGSAARESGELGEMANGAVATWSRWHVRALTWLGEDVAEPILLELLDEPEYESEAASALASTAGSQPQPPATRSYEFYAQIGEPGQHDNIDEERRAMYAKAISARIRTLLELPGDEENQDWINWRVQALAGVLAYLDGVGSIDLVLRTMGLPGRGGGWRQVAALEHLLLAHSCLPTATTLEILNPIIEQIVDRQSHSDQNVFLLERCLSIAAFVDQPAAGLAWVREVLTSFPLPSYRLRNLVVALGRSHSEDALDLLVELAQTYGGVPEAIRREWVDAVAAIDQPRSRNLLISFVDPDITDWDLAFPSDFNVLLTEHIAALAKKDSRVNDRILQLCSSELASTQRQLLANVLGRIGSEEAVVAGLALIDDDLSPSVPFHVAQAIECRLVGRQPFGASGGAYHLVPQGGGAIRARLFEFVMHDEHRRKGALELLAEIEGWRMDHGKPLFERRHPSIESGCPWPPLELVAGSGST